MFFSSQSFTLLLYYILYYKLAFYKEIIDWAIVYGIQLYVINCNNFVFKIVLFVSCICAAIYQEKY